MPVSYKPKKKYEGSTVRIEPLKKAFHVTAENYKVLSENGFKHYYVKNQTSRDEPDNADTSGETND